MPRNHRVIPLLDRFCRISRSVFSYPSQNCLVVVKLVCDLFECVTVDFQKGEQMLIEANGFIVVTVEQSFPVQPGLVDQTRQMHVTAQFLVRTARMQSVHRDDCRYVSCRGCCTVDQTWICSKVISGG